AVNLRLAGLNGDVAAGSRRAGLGHDGAHEVLVGVPDHPGDAVHSSKLLRSTLGVTAGHKDAALGIETVNPADKLSHFGVRRSGYGAGVENRDGISPDGLAFAQARFTELPLQRRAIRLARTTPKIQDMERSHRLSGL